MNLKQLIKDNPTMPPSQIARLAGCTVSAVTHCRNRLGLTGNIKKKAKQPDSKTIRKHKDEVIKLKNSGCSAEQIAESIGYCPSYVKGYLRELGYWQEKLIDKLEAKRDDIDRMLIDEKMQAKQIAAWLGISQAAMTVNLSKMGYHYCKRLKRWEKSQPITKQSASNHNDKLKTLLHSAWG